MMAAATLLAASCTDFDDYNQAYQTGSAESNVTLWGNISSRSDLSEFASLLVKGGFDKELDKSRFYTVWAPKNGTFDFATYNQMDSATLVDRFIKSNVADFNYVLSSSFNERVHALNEKSYTFQNENGSTYDENKVVEIRYEEIICFFSDKKYNYCKTKDMVYRIKSKLYEIEELDPNFIRISKSCIINITHVECFDMRETGKIIVIFDDNTEELVSKRKVGKILRYMNERSI